MIHQSSENDVLSNTSNKEKPQTLSTPIDREVEIQFLEGEISRRDVRVNELLVEIKKLRSEVTTATSRNATLHNCWQSAIAHHTGSEAHLRAWISRAAFKDSEIGELRRQIEELKGHLNPSANFARSLPEGILPPSDFAQSSGDGIFRPQDFAGGCACREGLQEREEAA